MVSGFADARWHVCVCVACGHTGMFDSLATLKGASCAHPGNPFSCSSTPGLKSVGSVVAVNVRLMLVCMHMCVYVRMFVFVCLVVR
jgi:hypothetical protein